MAEDAALPLRPTGPLRKTIDMIADLREVSVSVDHAVRLASCETARAAPDAVDSLRLALTEALNNVVEHAAHPSQEPVRLHVGGVGEVAWICIEDRGTPLPAYLLNPTPDPADRPAGAALSDALASVDTPEVFEAAFLPEDGWGWMLIHASVDRVEHTRREATNFTLLERTLGLPAEEA